MSSTRWERWSPASGLVATAFGAVGAACERGWPGARSPGAVAAFITAHRPAILMQSAGFLLSAAIMLWFLADLRRFLGRGRDDDHLPQIAYGAGVAWAALAMVAQAFQVGVAMAPDGDVSAPLLWTLAAMFGIANLPLAMMLGAVAVVSLRERVFPVWLGVVAIGAAVAQVLLWLGTFADHGPLAAGGWLSTALYPLFAAWLVPASILMLKHTDAAGARLTVRDRAHTLELSARLR
jgi:hypothetical protein